MIAPATKPIPIDINVPLSAAKDALILFTCALVASRSPRRINNCLRKLVKRATGKAAAIAIETVLAFFAISCKNLTIPLRIGLADLPKSFSDNVHKSFNLLIWPAKVFVSSSCIL